MPNSGAKRLMNFYTGDWLRADCRAVRSQPVTVQTFTESEDTRCCLNTILPPEDGHVNARNMPRIIVQETLKNKENCALKLVMK